MTHMTDADRARVHDLLREMERWFGRRLPPDARDMYFDLFVNAGMNLADVAAAIAFYLFPRWPPPALLLRAHRERVELDNRAAELALAVRLHKEPPSERRDALLNAIGFGRDLPPDVPKREM